MNIYIPFYTMSVKNIKKKKKAKAISYESVLFVIPYPTPFEIDIYIYIYIYIYILFVSWSFLCWCCFRKRKKTDQKRETKTRQLQCFNFGKECKRTILLKRITCRAHSHVVFLDGRICIRPLAALIGLCPLQKSSHLV